VEALAEYFKAGRVDAAVVWSPDDEDLVQNVPGSSILRNTKSASHIIADGFFVKEEYLTQNREMLKKLVEGWLIGAVEINSSPEAKNGLWAFWLVFNFFPLTNHINCLLLCRIK